jgi:hypothetical protein
VRAVLRIRNSKHIKEALTNSANSRSLLLAALGASDFVVALFSMGWNFIFEYYSQRIEEWANPDRPLLP